MEGRVDIRKLTLEELVGVVSIYPWYSGARRELCARMSRMGEEALSDRQFADAALHMPSRRILADMVRGSMQQDWADAEVEDIIKSYAEQQRSEEVAVKKVYAGVGDYFSQEEYDQVRRDEDNVFSRYAAKARNSKSEPADAPAEPVFDLYTETLDEGPFYYLAVIDSSAYDPDWSNNFDVAVARAGSEPADAAETLPEAGNPLAMALLALMAVGVGGLRRRF